MAANGRSTQVPAAGGSEPRGTAYALGLVSVVVAAFNADEYIDETCRSVLRQTYSPLELIVVDDGSTDGTAAIVAALAAADPRVRLFQQPNRGVAAARNAGIGAAAGEFLAVLDADDLWDPTKLERQVRLLRDAGPDAGLAYCWWAWMDAGGRLLDRSPRWRVEGHVLEKLVEINFTGNTSVPLFRRECVDAVGLYDVTLRARSAQGSEDWDLALRVAERYRLVCVPAVLVAYRRHAEGMSTACDTMWRSRNIVIEALRTRQPSLPPSVLRRSDGQYRLYLAGVAFWSRRYREALRWGLHSTAIVLAPAVLPYLLRFVLLRWLPRRAVLPTFVAGAAMDDESRLPQPLMPYDRIYDRLWKRQAAADNQS